MIDGKQAYSNLVGKRVKLTNINDKWTKLKVGACGTVTDVDFVPPTETVFTQVWVKWDNGSLLALIPESKDTFEVI